MVDKVDMAKIGARATLADTIRDKSFANIPGTIKKAVKSRGEYLIILDDGRSYYAFGRNVLFPPDTTIQGNNPCPT